MNASISQVVNLADTTQNGTPLVPEQIFQDVTAEHAFKTVTIEAFPHSASLQAASVHPCKHASVMRKLIERMNAGVVEEQKLQRKAVSKDGKKKWPFKRSGGSGKDDKVGVRAGRGGKIPDIRRLLLCHMKFCIILPRFGIECTFHT